MKSLFVFSLTAALAVGCGGGHEEEGHGEHGEEGHEEHGEGHEGEVEIAPEALETMGVELGTVERRALSGGTGIPAEIDFDPSSTAHVGSLVSGRFTKVVATLGARVSEGDLLAVVASSDVSESRARLARARARLTAAENAFERQRQLSSEGIGAERALVEAEAVVAELRAEVAGLSQQLSVFGSGRSGELRLTTPIDGIVVHVHATLGETTSPEEPAFVVTDPTRVSVRGSVPELEIDRVTEGAAAIVRLHAFPDLALPGTVTYLAPALDDETRSLPIRVTLAEVDPRLRGGLFGSIELIGDPDGRPLAVPAEAVATLEGRTVVFAPADEPNTFRPVPVNVGRRAGAFYEVRSGLEEGDTIVVTGAFALKSVFSSGELSEGHAH